MKEKRVGIVGAGVMANRHIDVLKRLGLSVGAVCDVNKEAAARTCKIWKIDHAYSDFSQMLNDQSLFMVSILTPPTSHAALAIEAIRRDVNVMVEKPLTTTMEEAKLILDSLKASAAKLGVVYHYLGTNVMKKALGLVRNGLVGEIVSVAAMFLQTSQDPMASNERHWSHQLPGGRFGEMLPHPVYIIQSLIGNELGIQTVLAARQGQLAWVKSDELHVLLRGDKSFAHIYSSFNAPRDMHCVDIFGSRKILRVDLLNHTIVQLDPMKITKTNSAISNVGVATQLYASTAADVAQFFSRNIGEPQALYYIYSAFLNSIEKRTEPLVTEEMAYNTVKTVQDICKCIES